MSANANSGSSPPVLTCRLTTAAVSLTPAERRAHAARVTAQRHHRSFFLCVCLSSKGIFKCRTASGAAWSRVHKLSRFSYSRRWVVRSQECLNMLLIRICDKWSHSGGAQSQRFLFCLFFYLTAGRDKFAVCDNMNACKRCIVPLYHVCWIKSTSLSYYLDATVGTEGCLLTRLLGKWCLMEQLSKQWIVRDAQYAEDSAGQRFKKKRLLKW